MSRFHIVACAVAVVIASSAAQAQFPVAGARPRLIQVIVSGGVTVPAGDLKDINATGFHYDASLLLNLPGVPLFVRPEFSLTRMKFKDPSEENPTTGYASGDVTKMMAALVNIQLPVTAGLYVLAGGGLVNLNTPDQSTSTDDDISQSKFAFDVGAGMNFRLGTKVTGFLEARFGAASYDAGKFGYSKASFIPVSFGLIF